MKKTLWLVIALAVLFGVAAGIYYRVQNDQGVIEKFFPRGAVVYIRLSDIDKSIKEFQSSQLWKNISQIDVEKVLSQSGLNEEQLTQYRKFREEISKVPSSFLLDEFFGRQVGIAFYPIAITALAPQNLSNLGNSVILISRLKPNAQFIEFVSRLYNRLDKNVQSRQERYGNYEITKIKVNENFDLAYAKAKGFLICSLNRLAVMKCLDVIDGKLESLLEDKDFVKTKKVLFDPSRTFFYLNFRPLISLFNQLDVLWGGQIPKEDRKKMENFYRRVSGLETLGYSSVAGRISKSKSAFFFDKSKITDDLMAQAYSCRPRRNRTFSFVPKDVMAYQWSCCLNLRTGWESIKREMDQASGQLPDGNSLAGFINQIETRLGMDFEKDIIPAVGDEFGGFLSDIDLDGLIPLPRIALFVELKDKSKATGILKVLLEDVPMILQTERYRGADIQYLQLPFGTNLQPGYTFIGDYLLVSTSRQLLKVSVDADRKQSLSILDNEDFESINFGLTEKTNSVVFVKTDKMIEKIKGIYSWAAGWMSLRAANIKAYQQGQKKRLEDLNAEIERLQVDMKAEEESVASLEREIAEMETRGEDVSLKKIGLENSQSVIRQRQEDIQVVQAKKRELEMVLQEQKKKRLDLPLMKLYFDEVFYPILGGLEVNKAWGSRSILKEDHSILESFSKSEE